MSCGSFLFIQRTGSKCHLFINHHIKNALTIINCWLSVSAQCQNKKTFHLITTRHALTWGRERQAEKEESSERRENRNEPFGVIRMSTVCRASIAAKSEKMFHNVSIGR